MALVTVALQIINLAGGRRVAVPMVVQVLRKVHTVGNKQSRGRQTDGRIDSSARR